MARGISGDGNVIVGHVMNNAMRHTDAGGVQYLGSIQPQQASFAMGVSGNGAVITGYGNTSGGTRAFRWTEGTGMVNIGSIGGGANESAGLDVSADGSIIVGWSGSPGGTQAVLWTQNNSIVPLGFLSPNHLQSRALGASLAGEFVVGTSLTSTGYEAFLWDSQSGMRNLKDVLTSQYGLSLAGWTLREAVGISDDGLTIAGNGVNPMGRNEAWIVHIPEPGTGIALLGILAARRRRR
jgi:probable HAF family extracellular repeat protein